MLLAVPEWSQMELDMLFDSSFGNAELGGNILAGQIIQPVHHEYLPPLLGHVDDGFGES